MVKDRIIKLDWVKWREIKDLQPKNLKQMFNYAHIENSIRKHGFAFPFGVWRDKKGDTYAIDGHTRIEVLSSMEDAPETLPAFFIDAKNRKEAIAILLEVYNQRTNPIDEDVLREFLEVEEIAVESIAVGSLNVFGLGGGSDAASDVDIDSFFTPSTDEKEPTFKIVLEYSQEDYDLVIDAFGKHQGSKEAVVFTLLGL
jgi:hypothetical protein